MPFGRRWRDRPEGDDPARDPYDRAAERIRDKAELDGRLDDVDAVLPPRKRNPLFVVVFGVFFILIIGQVAGRGGGDREPNLAASCTTPAFALSRTEIERGSAPVRITVVGPNSDRFTVAIDTARLVRRDDGSYRSEPLPGVPSDAFLGLTPILTPADCRVTGQLNIGAADAGRHLVSLFRLDGSGSELIDSIEVTVTEP